MRRAVVSAAVVALVIATVVAGIAAYALPLLAASVKQSPTTMTEPSTSAVATATSLQPTTTAVSNTTASGGSSTSGSSLVEISGSLSMPPGAGSGILAMTVTDLATYPITQIAIGIGGADGSLTMTWSAQDGATGGFGAAGGAVPTQVLAPTDEVTTGSYASLVGKVGGDVTLGAFYTFTVYTYFGTSATPALENFSVTAAVFHV